VVNIRVTRGSSAGNAKAPAVALGEYKYRALLRHGPNNLWISAIRPLFSYGRVPVSTLCNAPNASFANGCGPGTVQVGPHVFTYEFEGNANGCRPPDFSCILIQFPKNTCRTLTLMFGLDSNNSQPGEVANIQLIQGTLDPESSSTTQGSLGSATMRLDHGSWYLENNSTNGDLIYYNGWASCYSASGE